MKKYRYKENNRERNKRDLTARKHIKIEGSISEKRTASELADYYMKEFEKRNLHSKDYDFMIDDMNEELESRIWDTLYKYFLKKIREMS